MNTPDNYRQSKMINAIHTTKNDNKIPVIAEIKRFSPSHGDLLGDRSIKSVASCYEAGGASCISVVTGSWFKGSLSMLSETALHTSLPILRKDTIVSRDQIKQSQDSGASAVLLTSKILQKSHLEKMVDYCIKIGITPFVEVSDEKELLCVTACKEMIIGLANRDIALKETDVESGLKSLHLISMINRKAGAIISASGISRRDEADALIQSGFDGLLIATALLKSENLTEKLIELTGDELAGKKVVVS